MSNINIINAGTENSAQKDYENFLHESKTYNKRCSLYVGITFVVGLIICLAVEFTMEPGIWRNLIQVVVAIAASIIIQGIVLAMKPTTPYFYPATYQYHQLIKDYTILDTDILQGNTNSHIKFTVEDKDHRVKNMTFYQFKEEIRTDILVPTIDLLNRVILRPYK